MRPAEARCAESRSRRSNTSASSSGPPASSTERLRCELPPAGDDVDQRQRGTQRAATGRQQHPAAGPAWRDPARPAPHGRARREHDRGADVGAEAPGGEDSGRRSRPRRQEGRGRGPPSVSRLSRSPRGSAAPTPSGISTASTASSSLPIPKKRSPRPGSGPSSDAPVRAEPSDHVDRVGAHRDRAGDRQRAPAARRAAASGRPAAARRSRRSAARPAAAGLERGADEAAAPAGRRPRGRAGSSAAAGAARGAQGQPPRRAAIQISRFCTTTGPRRSAVTAEPVARGREIVGTSSLALAADRLAAHLVGTAIPRRSRIVGAMSVASTNPSVRVRVGGEVAVEARARRRRARACFSIRRRALERDQQVVASQALRRSPGGGWLGTVDGEPPDARRRARSRHVDRPSVLARPSRSAPSAPELEQRSGDRHPGLASVDASSPGTISAGASVGAGRRSPPSFGGTLPVSEGTRGSAARPS